MRGVGFDGSDVASPGRRSRKEAGPDGHSVRCVRSTDAMSSPEGRFHSQSEASSPACSAVAAHDAKSFRPWTVGVFGSAM